MNYDMTDLVANNYSEVDDTKVNSDSDQGAESSNTPINVEEMISKYQKEHALAKESSQNWIEH